jgi:hypothetical protein
LKAYATPVREVSLDDGVIRSPQEIKIQSFLNCININFNKVFWSKLPYSNDIKAAIESHRLKTIQNSEESIVSSPFRKKTEISSRNKLVTPPDKGPLRTHDV